MDNHLYWISTITYTVVLGIILFSDIKATNRPTKLENSYRIMTSWVIFFCVQDTLWGLCEANVIRNDSVFFISSSIFHLSTVITTYFWLKYVLDYLGEKVKHAKVYLIVDGFIICAEFTLVVLNCFTTTLFRIVDGAYVTGFLRPLTFINQYVVYLIIGITTLVLALKNRTKGYAHYGTVFLFTLAPILLGMFQLLSPDAPFYSLGYFLGCFIIHIFVVAHDREIYLSKEEKLQRIIDLNNELEEKQTEIDDQFDILKSISGMFDYIEVVDLNSSTASRFDKESVTDSIDIGNAPHTPLNEKIATRIDSKDFERFWTYTDLSTLDVRMRNQKVISSEFKYSDGDMIRAMYVRIGDAIREPITHVAFTLRNITSDRKREEQVYSALTNLLYSLHIADLENDTMERLIESDILKQVIGEEESAQNMINAVIKASCKDEYLDIMLEFVDLSTVGKRAKGKESLTCEFVGKFHGWTRMTFIPIEFQNNQIKKVVISTQIIDSEKSEIINLVYKSSTDELTRLYNRRMYEEELDAITVNNDLKNLIIIAMDVNGLKTVNDTLGHKAGDELIIGAAKCIEKSFASVGGKVYRTGGDEFMTILRCDKKELSGILAQFDERISNWSGNLVDSLSISYGYVSALDYPLLSVRDLASEADKRMYESKTEYYQKKGIDRRRT